MNSIVQSKIRNFNDESEKEKEKYVYISYSSKNADIADKCKEWLKANRINYWVAPENIPPSKEYNEVIPDAIENCSAFLLLITEQSQQSQWVPKELNTAISFKKSIFPLIIGDTALEKKFAFALENIQRYHLDKNFDDVGSLIKELSNELSNN